MIVFILEYNLQSSYACRGKCSIIEPPEAHLELCLLYMQRSVTSVRCEGWTQSEGLPGACRDTVPIRAHRDSSSSAQSILEARPQTIWGRDPQTQQFKEGGTTVGRGWEAEGGGGVSVVGGLRGKKWMGAEPRSTHLVRVGEERFGENSTLKDLSPISVETADKGDDMCTRTPNKQETLTPRRNWWTLPEVMSAPPLHPVMPWPLTSCISFTLLLIYRPVHAFIM